MIKIITTGNHLIFHYFKKQTTNASLYETKNCVKYCIRSAEQIYWSTFSSH